MKACFKGTALVLIFLVFSSFAQTNLALNKATTASTNESGNIPGNAVDGNTGTRWCAIDGTVPQWLKVDLGASFPITSSEVTWEKNGVYKYRVETSPDNITWTQRVDRTGNTLSQQTFTDPFATTARYVRITATGLASGNWASIFEFRVFGSNGNVAPTITTQPSNQTVTSGQTATFSLAATGTPAPTYQWRKNGANISGATSASYTTPATTTADNGAQFSCVVSNAAGNVTSNNATLTVNVAPPTITTQPVSVTVIEGQTATFSLVVAGTGPFTYQWRKNGVTISGATSPAYTTSPTTLADNGSQFSCMVSNAGGSVISNNATLNVLMATPVITTQPSNQTVVQGQIATFTITATSSGALTYQWRKNGASISGATSTSYTTPVATMADNGSQFSCVVANAGGNTISNNATLTVTSVSIPVITTNPANLRVNEGQQAVFSVTATGTSPLSYQWKKGTVNIGGNSSSLSIPAASASDAGVYWVIVSNAYGMDTSTSALLTVLPVGVKFNNEKLSVSGDLRDASGNPVGATRPDTVEMTVRVMNRDTGGVALCTERFLKANHQGVIVDKGIFTARLGEGTTQDSLKQVIANNPYLWVQIIIESATPDTLKPRTPLTASAQAMIAGGAQPLHGNGDPAANNVNALIGAYYINDTNGSTWLKINSGWRQLQ